MVDFYLYPHYTKKADLLVMFVTPHMLLYTKIAATGSQLPCKVETWVVATKILP